MNTDVDVTEIGALFEEFRYDLLDNAARDFQIAVRALVIGKHIVSTSYGIPPRRAIKEIYEFFEFWYDDEDLAKAMCRRLSQQAILCERGGASKCENAQTVVQQLITLFS